MYRKKWGPLQPLQRMDAAFARLYVSQGTGQRKMDQLMPWPREEEVEQPATPQQVFAFLSATVKKKPH